MDLLYQACGVNMNRNELEKEIEETRLQITEIKAKLDLTLDPKKEKRLEKKLKELQIHQLWLLDQLGWQEYL